MLILLIIVIIGLADLGSNFTSEYFRVCVKNFCNLYDDHLQAC